MASSFFGVACFWRASDLNFEAARQTRVPHPFPSFRKGWGEEIFQPAAARRLFNPPFRFAKGRGTHGSRYSIREDPHKPNPGLCGAPIFQKLSKKRLQQHFQRPHCGALKLHRVAGVGAGGDHALGCAEGQRGHCQRQVLERASF